MHSLRRLAYPALTLTTVLLMSACGSYEPPKPGNYTEIGSSKVEYACGTETPTATRFSVTRCHNIAEAKARGEASREAADSLRAPPPDVRSR